MDHRKTPTRPLAVINEIRAEGRLSIEQTCELAGVSRVGYYRQLARVKPAEADIELRDRIQRIALSNRRYGYRRVTAELRRQGFTVNHKKVLRLMRNDNLLAIRKRRYVLTTDSDQQRAAYPNCADSGASRSAFRDDADHDSGMSESG